VNESSQADAGRLEHIVTAIERVRRYASDGRATFLADPRTQDAVIRNLEIIGEAASRISGALQEAHPDLPWEQMRGLRNRLVHAYFDVDLGIVWDVVERELPELATRIAAIQATSAGTDPG
jgi:uncharacterized protein with HEPN domain